MIKFIGLLFSPVGRIRRRTYWFGLVGLPAASVALVVAAYQVAFLLTGTNLDTLPKTGPVVTSRDLFVMVIALAFAWSWICLHVKRWQDRGKSWPHIFIAILPLIGGIWTLIECGFLDGDHGQNRYGVSPKGMNRAPRLQL
jgi:uncharacterized membrane protein YhaH (DUF805 family)